MNDLTEMIAECFKPFKALLFYKGKRDEYYIESYDMGATGNPINAHPLSPTESQALADALDNSEELKASYLKGNQLFPQNLLYLNSEKKGYALWHTEAQKVNLFFKADLGIADGLAEVPPMLWKADRQSLQVWALKSQERPSENTTLYHAPFFNIYESGSVCMGNLQKQIPNGCSLLGFITLWEKYFFASTFSHALVDGSVRGETLTETWKRQVGQQTPFPTEILVKSKTTLKQLIR